ncbi:MAG: class I SAM-dependent methyltransferase [Myxococcales bacterium]|nr:class I SAM-dependent methyltransferase [Myxococcales bacterium]
MRDFDAQRDLARVQQLAAALGAEPPAEALLACARYVELVAAWNRRVDLTAARGAEAQAEVLLADAMALAAGDLLSQLGPRPSLLDVGTGAGAPLFPLLLLRPELRACAVEGLRRRVAFLRVAAARLGLLERLSICERKLGPEDAPNGLPGAPFALASSRATFEPSRWLELALGLSPAALLFTARAELPAAPEGTTLVTTQRYALPGSGAPRAISLYRRL